LNNSSQDSFVGIDVSGEFLDVCVLSTEEYRRFLNAPEGIDELTAFLTENRPKLVVLEATGGLETAVAAQMGSMGFPVAVVNPRHVRDFAKAVGQLAKTDRIDALILAKFAKAVRPSVQALKDEQSQALADLVGRRRQLVGMVASEKNRLLRARPSVVKDIRSHIAWLEKRIRQIDGDLQTAIKSTPIWRERDKLLQSVPGVGDGCARTLIAALPELGRVDNREIAALAGVAPLNCDSGKMRGRRSVWGGRAAVRAMLYMAAISAIRHNPLIRDFAERLRARGKKPKVVIVACMRKLLVILNAMIRTGTPWLATTAAP